MTRFDFRDRGFTVYPAIDLKGGQVVRLAEGDMARATVYSETPAEQARLFDEAGAAWVHVVDLDGAFAGEERNAAAVESIRKVFPGRVQLGGGIRTRPAIDRWFDLGVDRVVICTAALESPELVREASAAHPGRIVVAVDARDGMVATRGWAAVSDMRVADLAQKFEDAGVAAVLFTDVGRDGMLKGVNLNATRELAAATSLPVIASGGVANKNDIIVLRALAHEGIAGVVVGRAIYSGRLSLSDALDLAR